MTKSTTSNNRRKSLKNTQNSKHPKSNLKLKDNAEVIEYSPTEKLTDKDFIARAVWECLSNNDPEGVMEIIEIHLEAVNKFRTTLENGLSRATMYHALKGKNPTIKTLAKLVNCFSQLKTIPMRNVQ